MHSGMTDIPKRRRDGNSNKRRGRKSHGKKERQRHYGKAQRKAPEDSAIQAAAIHHGHEMRHDKGLEKPHHEFMIPPHEVHLGLAQHCE